MLKAFKGQAVRERKKAANKHHKNFEGDPGETHSSSASVKSNRFAVEAGGAL